MPKINELGSKEKLKESPPVIHHWLVNITIPQQSNQVYCAIVTARIRRMGKVMFSVCPHWGGGGGYPYPIMLCNISQNAMGQLGGGYPARSSRGGVPCQVQLGGGTLPGPGGGVPCQVQAGGGVPCQVQAGGVPCQVQPGGVPWPGGVPCQVQPGEGVPWPGGGGTQSGQHREYLLHGGRYASCVHAGGLSCWFKFEAKLNKAKWTNLILQD